MMSNYLNGIDVSHHNGDIDWPQVQKAEIRFVFIKLSEGTTFKDPKFESNWTGANKEGLLCAPYHFYNYEKDPIQQADFFIASFGAHNSESRLPPVLDLEDYKPESGLSLAKYQQNVLGWLNEVESKLHIKPMIYVSHYYANDYLNNSKFADYPLWLAQYGVKQPDLPLVWKDKGWAFWQNTPKGTVNGIIGDVDHDFLNPSSAFIGSFR